MKALFSRMKLFIGEYAKGHDYDLHTLYRPPVNPVRLIQGGQKPLWSKGYVRVTSKNVCESMNELADILNGELSISHTNSDSLPEVLAILLKLISTKEKPSDLTVYAAAAALHHSTRFNVLNRKLATTMLIPCIAQKTEYIDMQSLKQALSSLEKDPEFKKLPVVAALLDAEKKRPFAEPVEVQGKLWSPSRFMVVEKEKEKEKEGPVEKSKPFLNYPRPAFDSEKYMEKLKKKMDSP